MLGAVRAFWHPSEAPALCFRSFFNYGKITEQRFQLQRAQEALSGPAGWALLFETPGFSSRAACGCLHALHTLARISWHPGWEADLTRPGTRGLGRAPIAKPTLGSRFGRSLPGCTAPPHLRQSKGLGQAKQRGAVRSSPRAPGAPAWRPAGRTEGAG